MITNHHMRPLSFRAAHSQIRRLFLGAHKIHTERWQGVDISNQPAGQMLELLNVSIHVPQVPTTAERLKYDLSDSAVLPWAEDHFHERVCGVPINPGTEWANWPDGGSAAKFLDENGQFNHNYMERYWPKYAGLLVSATGDAEDYRAMSEEPSKSPLWVPSGGIRHEYGDLNDLVELLLKEPDTRQAYLPIFFPEDTGIGDGGRKPCTLGYHFIVRDNKLHTYYPMRSCDFYRHWGDDCYMTVRLGMWIIEECRSRDQTGRWSKIEIGSFSMHTTSLHMFFNDFIAMSKEKPL